MQVMEKENHGKPFRQGDRTERGKASRAYGGGGKKHTTRHGWRSSHTKSDHKIIVTNGCELAAKQPRKGKEELGHAANAPNHIEKIINRCYTRVCAQRRRRRTCVRGEMRQRRSTMNSMSGMIKRYACRIGPQGSMVQQRKGAKRMHRINNAWANRMKIKRQFEHTE